MIRIINRLDSVDVPNTVNSGIGGIGFTLIELLVVIAIIGILSSIAMVNLNVARDKAQEATVLSSLSNIVTAIGLCFDDGKNLTHGGNPLYICEDAEPQPGAALCGGDPNVGVWPILPDGWLYNETCNSDVTSGSFYFSVTGPRSCMITCDNTRGCAKEIGYGCLN